MVKITVPATSANLGAGFDSLGLALAYYNQVEMSEDQGVHIFSEDGVAIPTDESNLIYQTAKSLYEKCGKPFSGLRIVQRNRIPLARGLGSKISIRAVRMVVGGSFWMERGCISHHL